MSIRLSQIELVAAICHEIARQHPGAKVSQGHLPVITQAADRIVQAFEGNQQASKAALSEMLTTGDVKLYPPEE